MQKFLVLYMMPNQGMEEWMKTDPETRKAAEDKMKSEWDAWASEHKDMLKETAGAGKTKRINKEGTSDVKNDVMMYSIVEAESPEAAAKIFDGHPHLGIPNAWIDVMPANMVPGMGS